MLAKYFTSRGNGTIKCDLCPHECLIEIGKSGICKVRQNEEGNLFAKNYGLAVGLGLDPIEKKPLYHYYPGSQILSIGTPGCNLKCFFCQNYDISQEGADSFDNSRNYLPQNLLDIANNSKNNAGIAFTYNEPVVFFEYMVDTARLFKKNGYHTVMVSNGYINPEPLEELIGCIDAFNIDLKAFDDSFYKKYTKSTIKPVLNTISTIAGRMKHLEITYLVIPGLNDDHHKFRDMLNWISDTAGKECVLHLSRYYPRYKSTISATPEETLEEFYEIASDSLDYVFLGNVNLSIGNNTICPGCGQVCISRNFYRINNYLSDEGYCPKCGRQIIKY